MLDLIYVMTLYRRKYYVRAPSLEHLDDAEAKLGAIAEIGLFEGSEEPDALAGYHAPLEGSGVEEKSDGRDTSS